MCKNHNKFVVLILNIEIMKAKILLIMNIITFSGFAQDNLQSNVPKTQIFSLSPISKKVDKLNGLVFGVGHVENKRIANQKINGLNVEVNPAPVAGVFMAFLAVIHLPDIIKQNFKQKDSIKNDYEPNLKIKNWNYTPNLKINGVNLSTGCFFTPTSMNGLNISLANKFKNFNGLSIAPLGTISDNQYGLSIGIVNANNTLIGSSIGVYNQSYELKGVQIGFFNQVKINKGLQIGILNKSMNRGFQLGLWNKNKKRGLPLFNW